MHFNGMVGILSPADFERFTYLNNKVQLVMIILFLRKIRIISNKLQINEVVILRNIIV